MLHKIESPACGKRMKNILKFQGEVLELACDPANATLTEQAVKNKLGQERGKWLWDKLSTRSGKKMRGAIETIAAHVNLHPKAGKSILDAYNQDILFHENLTVAAFRFSYGKLGLGESVAKALSDLMQAFYTDLLASGFPKSINEESKKFNRDSFLEAFYQANATLQVCPSCDGPRADTIDLKTYADADHFLPKSIYPFLSVHSSNLVPICLNCNRSFKGDRDPIADPDENLSGSLMNSFHPYGDPAISHIEVRVVRSNKEARPEIVERTDGARSRRIGSINRVFKLEERWLQRLKGEMAEIIRYVADMGETIRLTGGVISKENLRTALKHVFIDKHEERIGTRADHILRNSYVRFMLDDDDEFGVLYEYYTGQRSAPGNRP